MGADFLLLRLNAGQPFFSFCSFAWVRARAFFLASSAFKSFAFPRVPGVVFLVEGPLFAAPCPRPLDFVAIS